MKILEEVVIEVIKEDRKYRFSMPKNAPLGEVYDSMHQALSQIVLLAQKSVDMNAGQSNVIQPEVVSIQGDTHGTSTI